MKCNVIPPGEVELITTRTVFDTGGNGIEVCRASCGEIFEPGERYMDAIEAWLKGDNDAIYVCDRCGHPTRLTDWSGPWAFGFGFLGLSFRDWPPLHVRFLEDVALVIGSRLLVVLCKI